MRAAFDTNILAYACRIDRSEADFTKADQADALIGGLSDGGAQLFVAAQSLLELFEVLTRKGGWSRPEAAGVMERFAREFAVVPTDTAVLAKARIIAVEHHLRIFDATILAAAASVDCETLYSEDMHHGFAWQGVTILNPFRE